MKVPKASFVFNLATNSSSFPELLDEETECDLENGEDADTVHQRRTMFLTEKMSTHCSSSRVSQGLGTLETAFTPTTLSTISSDLIDTHTNIIATDSESFSNPCFLQIPGVEDIEDIITTPTLSFMFGESGIVESPIGGTVLSTPCVLSALRDLYLCQTPALPDILEIIDDDSRGLDDLERQLLRNDDFDLTDANVADYLLYVAADSPSERRCVEERRQSVLSSSSCRVPSRPQWAKMRPQLLELKHNGQRQRQHAAGCITPLTDANEGSADVECPSLQRPQPHRGRRRDKRPTQEELAALVRQPLRSCRRAAATASQSLRSRPSASSLPQSSLAPSCDKLAVRRSNRLRKTTARYATSWSK